MNPITLYEELSLNAFPAFYTMMYDGWMLRSYDGHARRANSIQMLYPGSLPLPEKVAHCRRVYDGLGKRTVFKLTSDPAHQPVDAWLASEGYALDSPTLLMARPMAGVPALSGGTWAAMDSFLTPAWLEDTIRMGIFTEQSAMIFARQQTLISLPCSYMRVIADGQTVAAAMAVLERGYLGIYDVVVAANQRRRGYGRQLMLHLLNWGAAEGAHTAYLQVMTDNAAARALYDELGFTRQYDYWYRQMEPSQDG
jgi:ribosomal protein S18 acetylase RimI-like enzyme